MKKRDKRKNKPKNISVIVTSIFDGSFLTSYTKKMMEEGVVDRTRIIVIPDRKSPHELYQKCQILKDFGFNINCPTLEEQEEYLKKLGAIYNIVPYDSDNRRNIGYLMAYDSGDEIVISIDDDNYPIEGTNFYKEHTVVGSGETRQNVVHNPNGWFNNCSLLKFRNTGVVYPRGYPYFARFSEDQIEEKNSEVDVHINTGLWLKEPDVDAITWLGVKPYASSFSNRSVVLSKNTWTTINTQNTGLNKAVIPSYWFVKMGYTLSGLPIDRYGDIFSGYFAQTCVKHLGYGIRIGSPIVKHIRNSHNHLKDIQQELGCITVLEDLLQWLTEVKLDGSTYTESYLSLAYQMEDAVQKFDGFVWNTATRGYFHHLAYCMRVWVNTIKTVDGEKTIALKNYNKNNRVVKNRRKIVRSKNGSPKIKLLKTVSNSKRTKTPKRKGAIYLHKNQ